MPQILNFSDLQWLPKHHEEDPFGPGPNFWLADNAEVIKDDLHLRIRRQGGRWACAEVYTKEALGYGTYTFQIVGQLDKLDPQIVLGLAACPLPDTAPDGMHEITIATEVQPHTSDHHIVFKVYPTEETLVCQEWAMPLQLNGTHITYQFQWTRSQILFKAWHGHTAESQERLITEWLLVPEEDYLPHRPMPLHLNLWLKEGVAPRDGKEVEIVIRKFTYEPALFLTLAEIQIEQILAVLEFTEGRIEGPRGAAKILAIPPTTLRDRIKQWGLEKKHNELKKKHSHGYRGLGFY
ncbi:MAG: hypothetical protein GKR89_33210 [Candidatus Latescibacteria bacterium]|nr:hypothetical protein [Candidatus Latescibacterota bacterium]